MENTRGRFPATYNVHNGIYRDGTLAKFEEREIADPDLGTKWEGTVHEIPPQDDGLIGPIKRQMAKAKREPTEAPRAVALADQHEKVRRAKQWWAGLSPQRRAQLTAAFPHLKAA